jgi:hypothetical protein
MNTRSLLLIGATAAALSTGASNAVSASTDATEPAGSAPTHTEAGHPPDTTAATLAVDGSAEPTSPQAAAFCAAEVAVEAAAAGGDPTAIESANAALLAAAPDDEVRATVEAVLATVDAGGPEFEQAYTAVLDYMRANCGYAELGIAASEYTLGGFPTELPVGPVIIDLANVGTEVHEAVILRIDDDVTLTVEELTALPREDADTMVTFTGVAFAFPGSTGHTVIDLTAGRYVALCGLPQGATPEIIAEMGPGGTAPPGAELGAPHLTLGMIHEFTVA